MRVLFTLSLVLFGLCASAQSPCSSPKLVLPDTVSMVVHPRLEKADGCEKAITYHLISYTMILARGGSPVMTWENLQDHTMIASFARPGDRVSIEVTKAEREINGQRMNLTLGKWARKVAIIR